MSTFNITGIQLFDYAVQRQINEEGDFVVDYTYSANLIINDEFVVQVSGSTVDCTFDGVAASNDVYWNNEDAQDNAYETIDDNELEELLEADGFENNIGWLEDNATDIINPENAIYRHDNSDTK